MFFISLRKCSFSWRLGELFEELCAALCSDVFNSAVRNTSVSPGCQVVQCVGSNRLFSQPVPQRDIFTYTLHTDRYQHSAGALYHGGSSYESISCTCRNSSRFRPYRKYNYCGAFVCIIEISCFNLHTWWNNLLFWCLASGMKTMLLNRYFINIYSCPP